MSLPHSGSTLLDLILSRHPAMTGLGEAARTIRTGERGLVRSRGFVCADGTPAAEQPFWAAVFEENRASDDPAEAYQILLAAAAKALPSDTILVDSGKYAPFLQALHARNDVHIKVIHLVRDVRGFTISSIDKAAENGRRVSALRLHLRWLRRHRLDMALLETLGLPVFRVGYDRLALQPADVIPEICEFLELPFDAAMLRPDGTGCLALRGNRRAATRVRDAQAGLSTIRYDARWMAREEWTLPHFLLPQVRRANRRWVYGVAE